uniref:Permuted papain-like amidase n=1 Tax=Marseillevirus LCMAC101 TaxID=2506602 RepID=A0A481YR66_9VIRU|nr:MAG: permuted papain-like amidase [Marseillevirus LCMAC101]
MRYLNLNLFEWLIFIIALLLILFYFYILASAPKIEAYVKKNEKYLNWLNYEDILNEVENGDLILLAGDTHGEKLCRWFPGSIFSHMGLLIREKQKETGEDRVYIWDCDLGQGYKEGVRMSLLDNKIRRYKGFRIGALKKLKVSPGQQRPNSQDIVELYQKYKDLDFDHVIATWFLADYPKLYKLAKNPEKVFCGEMVAEALQELGIMKKDRVPAWYVPGDFYRPADRLHLEDGYEYGTTYFFRFPDIQTEDGDIKTEHRLVNDIPFPEESELPLPDP